MLAQAILRYGITTLLWVFTTQWFFGPPLIDRGFRATGGRCEVVDAIVAEGKGGGKGGGGDLEAGEVFTAAACKFVGGAWAGGHDISGHVFILVLGSAFLGYELLSGWVRASAVAAAMEGNAGREGEVRTEEEEEDEEDDEKTNGMASSEGTETGGMDLSLYFVAGVICTSLWMLLMTATYFHTWFEKVCRHIFPLILLKARPELTHETKIVDRSDRRFHRDRICVYIAGVSAYS